MYCFAGDPRSLRLCTVDAVCMIICILHYYGNSSCSLIILIINYMNIVFLDVAIPIKFFTYKFPVCICRGSISVIFQVL